MGREKLETLRLPICYAGLAYLDRLFVRSTGLEPVLPAYETSAITCTAHLAWIADLQLGMGGGIRTLSAWFWRPADYLYHTPIWLTNSLVEKGGIEPLPEGSDLQSDCHIQDDFPFP